MQAHILVCADTTYRLFINGERICDGPVRFYPEHVRFDRLDITKSLRAGDNNIKIIANYWGCKATTRIPVHAGLIAEIIVDNEISAFTDRSWRVRNGNWETNTPYSSFSLGPYEYYNAEKGEESWQQAVELFAAHEGPWQDLTPRDCPFLTADSRELKLVQTRKLPKRAYCYSFPFTRLIHKVPNVGAKILPSGGAAFTTIVAPTDMEISYRSFILEIYINGIKMESTFKLNKGDNFVSFISPRPNGFQADDPWFLLEDVRAAELKYRNPSGSEGMFCFIHPKASEETRNMPNHPPRDEELQTRIMEGLTKLRRLARPVDLKELEASAEYSFTSSFSPTIDPHIPAIFDAADSDATEYMYDLGTQSIGYISLEIEAESSAEVVLYMIEYITEEGIRQHTIQGNTYYRNGFGLKVPAGTTKFRSMKRRSGRYVVVSVKGETKIAGIEMEESVYPIKARGSFECSDSYLNKLWEISARTLELCMEDTYTDCPLYEQNFWVGDMRNEALFAYNVFGGYDLTKRSLKLAAESLDHQDLIVCCAPRYFTEIIPIWSFLWVVALKEFYLYSGESDAVLENWAACKTNINNTKTYINEEGLFDAPFWNMFDWGEIDWMGRRVVLFNSIMLGGALDSCIELCEVTEDQEFAQECCEYKASLITAVNKYFKNGAYPDNTDNLNSGSQITLAVAYLHGFLDKKDFSEETLKTLTEIGSPFSLLYLYEAYEKAGDYQKIISHITSSYRQMVESGATTVWEVFPGTPYGPKGFPTRSHAHAWSSVPVYFFTRIILGVTIEKAGGEAYAISPRPGDLSEASGTIITAKGKLKTSWKKEGNSLNVYCEAPEEISVSFKENEEIAGLEITFARSSLQAPQKN